MKTVGYAIVGTGYFGAELGRIMKEQEGAKIVAVLDPENGQTIADELGCDVETDLDGFSNSACEVGYMHMNDSDFQTLGAASILTKKVSEWKGETEKKWDGYHIFEEAKKGDKLCLLAIDEMVDILGEGIANICYVINPEVVVLGGGIMAQEQFLKERVECAVKRYLVYNLVDEAQIGRIVGYLNKADRVLVCGCGSCL